MAFKKKHIKEEVKEVEQPMIKNEPDKEVLHAQTADISKEKGIIVHCEDGKDVVFNPRFFKQVVYEFVKQNGGDLK
jgi:hypothetical protein